MDVLPTFYLLFQPTLYYKSRDAILNGSVGGMKLSSFHPRLLVLLLIVWKISTDCFGNIITEKIGTHHERTVFCLTFFLKGVPLRERYRYAPLATVTVC